MRVEHKIEGWQADTDTEVHNLKGDIVIVHIPALGWRNMDEFKKVRK